MNDDDAIRGRVASELDELATPGRPLATTGRRATISDPELFDSSGLPTRNRRRFHREVVAAYLARHGDIRRQGKAALITAGPPGAGKSSIVDQTVRNSGWRRLDADIVKNDLIVEAVSAHRYDDLLVRVLADGHPILPAELASLVHVESVAILALIRRECLARGENVVIEGTLAWPQAGRDLLDELISHSYRDVTIVDVEVPQSIAHERAMARWWHGRQQRIRTGGGLGGRFTPPAAIDRAFADGHGATSICAINARDLFNSDAAAAIARMTLTVHDGTDTSTERRGTGKPPEAP